MPRRDGGSDRMENLITLCATCHAEWEGLEQTLILTFDRWMELPPSYAILGLLLNESAWHTSQLSNLSAYELRQCLLSREVADMFKGIQSIAIRKGEPGYEEAIA